MQINTIMINIDHQNMCARLLMIPNLHSKVCGLLSTFMESVAGLVNVRVHNVEITSDMLAGIGARLNFICHAPLPLNNAI